MEMATRLGEIAAIAHRAPSTILRPALIHEEPAASALVLALFHPLGPRARHQADGRPGDGPEQRLGRGAAFELPFQGMTRSGKPDPSRRSGKPVIQDSDVSCMSF